VTWSWKVPDRGQNPRLNLRYEPGCWGDVLKGEWALTLLAALPAPPGVVLDPWAGAPTYPLVDATRDRLAGLRTGPLFRAAQAGFLAEGQLASTGRLLLAGSPQAELRVFDLDPERRARWAQVPGATTLAVGDGADALRAQDAPTPDLVLVDPYDLFDAGGPLLEPALSLAAKGAPVLFYLYNKAPRSPGHMEQYASLRRQLERRLPSGVGGPLVGRVPADALLPRAYHEVLLVGSGPLLDQLRAPLAEATHALAREVAGPGEFEG
jgi:hypothetical protein